MKDSVLSTPYAVPCRNKGTFHNTVLYGASSVPGSASLKYLPVEPYAYKYGIDTACAPIFNISIIWKGTPKITSSVQNLIRKLSTLPLLSESTVTYMDQAEGYFFNLILKDNIRITLSQYEEKWDKGAYVNVILDTEPVIQGFMTIDDLIESMKEFYNG